ncbi:2-hydroxyethylphosphonate dioxygenase [Streptomyces sp. NPDC048516]|uniref:2-hydroxyethylphosphonate dioxygenase n=1 Tax=Streptomyces sp. NPDC048516 TaxID=3365565 RepID=UPI0037223216
MRIDPFKLAHWMNARKYTLAQTADRAGLPHDDLRRLLSDEDRGLDPAQASALAAALSLEPAQLAGDAQRNLTVVHKSADEMLASRRPIQRDGIHFYNYYTLAAPEGRVAPVVLDILCPPDRLPALNNGHLEPAITVNLGPGDINGRWGEEITPQTWRVLHANQGTDHWIVGDSYVEPSYCPHSYSLAGDAPARIVSYTARSNVAPLMAEANSWSPGAFEEALKALSGKVTAGPVLDLFLARRVHTRTSAAAVAGLEPLELEEAVRAPLSEHGIDVMRRLGRALGFDYRVLLPADDQHDGVGKTWTTIDDSRRSARAWGTYQAASMASASHLPDLTGTFLRVDGEGNGADLIDHAENHYFVADGRLTLEWDGPDGPASVELGPDGSAWTAPFVRHRWHGIGTVLKFGSGAHLGYQDWLELTNTYEPTVTLRRGRRDVAGWGYDN